MKIENIQLAFKLTSEQINISETEFLLFLATYFHI